MSSFCMAWGLHKKEKLQFLLYTLKKIKRIFPIVILSALLVSPTEALPQSSPQYGGILSLGSYRKPAPFNPFKVFDSISTHLMELIFSQLIQINHTGEIEPDLALRWEVSADGLVYTFYLREHVKFHDGTECTSQDVLATYQRLSDASLSPDYYKYFEIVDTWKAPSKHIFQAILKKPFPPFLRNLRLGSIASLNQLNSEQAVESLSRRPVGTGPFMYQGEDITKEEVIHLKANRQYFEAERPYLNEIQMKFFSNKNQVWAAFLRNEIDVMLYLNRSDYEEIAHHPAFNVIRVLPAGGYALFFNLKDPFLADVNIRKAINLAINRPEIIDKLEDGQGFLISGPFHPNTPVYDHAVKIPDYDAEKSREILKEQKFVSKKGLWEKDGYKFQFNLLVEYGNEHSNRMAKIIRQQLYEIGILVQISFFSNLDDLTRKIAEDQPFQGYIIPFSTGTDPDTASRYWASDAHGYLGNYANVEVNRLFQEGRNDIEIERRIQIYRKIHRIIAEDYAAAFLYIPYVFYATSASVQNTDNFFGPFLSFFSLKEVYKLNNVEKGGGNQNGNYRI